MSIEWKDPTDEPTRAQKVAEELRGKPGQWAMVESGFPTIGRVPWWRQLENEAGIEVHVKRLDDTPLGRREVYARRLPTSRPGPPPPPANLPDPAWPGTRNAERDYSGLIAILCFVAIVVWLIVMAVAS